MWMEIGELEGSSDLPPPRSQPTVKISVGSSCNSDASLSIVKSGSRSSDPAADAPFSNNAIPDPFAC